MKKQHSIILLFFILFLSCRKDEQIQKPGTGNNLISIFTATPYQITYPLFWSKNSIQIPLNNPMTVEGVALGRLLFYDPILSKDSTLSCSSCHKLQFAFTDTTRFSTGITGQKGTRNAPALFNLGWFSNYGLLNHLFFWDGGAADIESQALGPITNPIEMNETLFNVIRKIKSSKFYPQLFKKAFGTDSVTTQLMVFAIAQFERTFISGNSKFDQGRLINFTNLNPSEINGLFVFTNTSKGDCWHCHTLVDQSSPFSPDFGTDFRFHNNGLQIIFSDSGLARITKNPSDMGKFKTPSVRNLVFTGPYMHDGRFATLEQVVNFYDTMAYQGTNADPFITSDLHKTGLNLSNKDKSDLIAFLKTLTDSSFITNTEFMKY